MANELQVTAALTFAKGNFATLTRASGSVNVTVSGSKIISAVQSIGFAGEEAIQIGELSTLGYGLFHNLDATNFVVIRSATGVTTGVKLKANEWAIFRLSGNAPFAIADTGACLLEYLIVED